MVRQARHEAANEGGRTMFGGLKDFGALMKQAQEMQQKLGELQERLAETEVVGQSGGGMVKVTLNGKNEARRVEIDPSLLAPDEKGVLEDLIVAAANDARVKVETLVQDQMRSLTG